VERIQKIEVLDLNFKSSEAFDANEYVKGAFGIAGGKPELVELLFDPAMSGYIRERVWHESQDLQERPDGSIVLRMHVAPSWELKSWIKGFLPQVRVIQPAQLRSDLAKEIAKSAKAFRGKTPGGGRASATKARRR
jgi:predicted DNA-binding transcriptional regulator YafY